MTQPRLSTFTFDVVTVDAQGQETSRTCGQAQSFTEDLGSEVGLDMVLVPGGSFLMGSPAGKGFDEEKPQHLVRVPPFFIGKYLVTQEQWFAVSELPKVNCGLGPDPSGFKGAKRPVEKVSWEEAVEFCDRLAYKTGRAYCLPSEVEWEYACRAGTTTPFHFGETITTNLANYHGHFTYSEEPQGEPCKQTMDVGSFPPNAFGLYDMHGNVWEWCADHWHANYEGAPTDGSAWVEGGNPDRRVLRGGSWHSLPGLCRSALRIHVQPGGSLVILGFRVVCADL